jgi:hypothetical protein
MTAGVVLFLVGFAIASATPAGILGTLLACAGALLVIVGRETRVRARNRRALRRGGYII